MSHVRQCDMMPLLSPFRKRAPLRRPFQPEKKFFDSVRMKQIVQGDVPKHDEHGIVTVIPMFGGPCPGLGWKRSKPRDEGLAAFYVLLY